MPRVQGNTTAPGYQEVLADVERLGPLTRQFAESLAAKMDFRRPNGNKLPYAVRQSRGTDYIHSLLYRGAIGVADVARAVHQYHTDRAQAQEQADVTPFYGYK